MENIFDRLQFVKHEEVFATREAAYDYVLGKQIVERPSLLAEPMILLYESDDDSKGPNVILAIGSVGDGTASQSNRTFFIDTQKTEEEIEELREEIEEAIKSLILIPIDSDTLDISTEKTSGGTIISGDVKIADYEIVGGVVNPNIIKTVDDKGIYAFVDMNYDPETFAITFTNGIVTKEFQLPPDQHLVKGWYDRSKESLVLKLADNSKVEIDVVNLIDEWTVVGSASTTPIMLFKEHVSSYTESHEGVYDWQDILEADVRVADHISDNIVHKDRTGRYLYVKGTADNIKYKEGVTVKDALDNIDCNVSTSTGNLIYKRPDGIYAYAMLDYNVAENKLKYTYSDGNDEDTKFVEFQLNSVKILEDITYDPVNEEIVIRYIDAQGEYQTVRIPVRDIIEEWDVNNEAHNINLVKYRSTGQGKDILSADAKIYNDPDNILVDRNHELFVKGTADNIKYGTGTVKGAIDSLKEKDVELNEKVDQEIADRTSEIQRIDNTIGTGFTSDPHENVTAKFESLDEKIEAETERATSADTALNEKIDAEITRSTEKDTEHDGRLYAIDEKIGDGFGPRNTIRDEFDKEKTERENADNALQNEIEAVSADSANSLKDIVNVDESINIDKTDPTKPVISVNLSEEVEQGKENIIKLNADGLYAGVDLAYEATANKLIFTTTNGSKEIQLDSMSSIISIEYNPTKEAIVITYLTNGHEIKTVEIPVGDLINEWRVEDGHPHAVQLEKVRIASGTSEQDVLKASVIITDDHDDNILVMDDGTLYVPANTDVTDALADSINAETARAISADTVLQSAINAEALTRESGDTTLSHLIDNEVANRQGADSQLNTKIETETTRAREAETRIETSLNNEVSRAQTKEGELNSAIVNETLRAQAADNELYQSIADETAARISGDAELQSQINQEASRAQVAETTISERLGAEVNRSTLEDQAIRDLLTAETASRQEGDAELEEAIRNATLTFDDTSSIDFTKTTGNVVTADVKLQEGNNIIKCGQGLYASVDLSYDPGTNKIKLVTSNGDGTEIQLVGASLLEDLHYDATNKTLVITYKDATGEEHTVQFGVSELFNEWDAYNPTEKSAVELTKTPSAEPGGQDKLSGRVLITDDHNGDGKPDEGSPNIIEIRNNGLFVDGSILSGASETAECVKKELKVVEKAVLGHVIGEECGEGYTYEPNNTAQYINTAISFYNADYILDQAIKNVDIKVDEVSAKTDCVDEKSDKIYELLYGAGSSMPECGEGASYQPYVGACIISAATSFMEADRLLNDQVCSIFSMWTSAKTCSTESKWVEDGSNKKMEVNVRLSRGKFAEMTDDDIIIETFDGPYIDPTRTEFTDTNALRIVCLDEAPSGSTPSVDSLQNGVYLSNVWDCGLYYGPSDTEAKAAAEAAGYITNYNTDEDSSASNYNYMNNVRQEDIPVI